MPGDETRIVKGWDIATNVPTVLRITGGRLMVDTGVTTTSFGVVRIPVTPTITAGAYAAGDALGGLLTFANAVSSAGGAGLITKVVIIDDAQQLAPVDLVLFDQTFTATADNAPFDPTDADLQNSLGYIDVAATDYANFADNAMACKASGLRMPFEFQLAAGQTSLFGQLAVRDTPTYVATDDITVILTIERYA